MFTALVAVLVTYLSKNGLTLALKCAPFVVLLVSGLVLYFSSSTGTRIALGCAAVSEFVVAAMALGKLPSITLPASSPKS